MTEDRSFENNGRVVRENLIDPGPIPDVEALRPQQRETRRALNKIKAVPMRRGMDR
jgi:hypothetical protein